MERQANYALVGLLSVVLLLGSLVFIVWLAQFRFNETYDDYRIIFKGPVSGLSKGGDIQLNGIKVGEITSITLDPQDANRIITDIQVAEDTPIRTDSVAVSKAQGITGVKFVQITPGSPSKPFLRTVGEEDRPIIASQSSEMENLVQNVSKLTESGAEALARVNLILSDQNIGSIARSLSDVNAVTAEFRDRKSMFAKIDSTFGKLDRAATDLQLSAASARTALGGDNKGMLGELSMAAAELRGTVADARKIVAKVDGPVTEFSTTTVPNINAAMGSIQQAADALDRLVSQIEQDPHSLIARPKGKEVEIPQ